MAVEVIRTVGRIMEEQLIPTPKPEKFATVIELALRDTFEHGGLLREQQIRNLVLLLRT